MCQEGLRIRNEQDFFVLLDELAKQIRNANWTQSTDDILECMEGMIGYLDDANLDLTSDGLNWEQIGAMIQEGVKRTKAYQCSQPDLE